MKSREQGRLRGSVAPFSLPSPPRQRGTTFKKIRNQSRNCDAGITVFSSSFLLPLRLLHVILFLYIKPLEDTVSIMLAAPSMFSCTARRSQRFFFRLVRKRKVKLFLSPPHGSFLWSVNHKFKCIDTHKTHPAQRSVKSRFFRLLDAFVRFFDNFSLSALLGSSLF
jgi:hypothetical protein